jgi:hypothetical protein
VAQLAITLFCFYASQVPSPPPKSNSPEAADAPSNLPERPESKHSGGISSRHAVDAIDALRYPFILIYRALTFESCSPLMLSIYLEFAGADVPRFYSKLANLFLYEPTTLEQNVKELVSITKYILVLF